MPLTTANLSGVLINEIGATPDGANPLHDIDGDGVSSGAGDEYVELYNSSGSTVDISGWQLYIIDNGSSASGLVHTFAASTTIGPGGYMVIIDNEGSGSSPQNIGSAQGVISNGNRMVITEDDSYILYDPGTNSYIELLGDITTAGDLADIAAIFGPSGFNATLVGSESLPSTSDPTGTSFQRVPDGDTNIVVGAQTAGIVNCFLAGTHIATPDGDYAVESLKVGDRLSLADGGTAEVKFILEQTVSTRFGPAERLMPVRFAAGSLGNGLPTADLTVTADHGMLVEGVICHAGALVNGTTITRVPLAELGKSYTVYHIETEAHEIILTNGAPAETFIDNVSRRSFDNFAEFDALYGDVPELEELPYPRAMSARQVPESIRSRLAMRKIA
jgi:hypothetical protein